MEVVYGPYKRRDGRSHLVIIDGKKRKTISYPKWLMQVHLGRELSKNETIDHIDGDVSNNSIDNLQILSLADNIRKAIKPAKLVELKCKFCGGIFTRRAAVELYNRTVRKKDGPFCSHRCSGKVFH